MFQMKPKTLKIILHGNFVDNWWSISTTFLRSALLYQSVLEGFSLRTTVYVFVFSR